MSTLYERIIKQTTRLGIQGNEFGELLGLKKSPLTDWKNEKSKPTLDQLKKMCEIFAVSSDYLLFGNTSKNTNVIDFSERDYELINAFRSLPVDEQNELIGILNLKIQKQLNKGDTKLKSSNLLRDETSTYNSNPTISILGYVAAGEPILSYENEINTIVPESDKVSYALIAKGNSMEPIILDGEIIEVISQSELENGEIGIIKVDNAVTCKCFYSMRNRYELKSLNPDIDPIIIYKDSKMEIHIIGKVALTNIQQSRYNSYFKTGGLSSKVCKLI